MTTQIEAVGRRFSETTVVKEYKNVLGTGEIAHHFTRHGVGSYPHGHFGGVEKLEVSAPIGVAD